MRSFLALFLAVFALVALFSSNSFVAADPEFISGGDSAYVPGVSAVDWGNGHIEQPYISSWASGGSGWGGRKSGGSSWTSTKTSTPAKSNGGGRGWGKKRRSSEVSPPVVEAEEAVETAVKAEGQQN